MMDNVTTKLLGQFEDDVAQAISERLSDRGIVWWEKRSGSVARLLFAGDWGTRLFVDEERMHDAQQIADELTS